MMYDFWCRDAAFIKLKIENWKLKNVFVFAVGTWRATFFDFWFLIFDFWFLILISDFCCRDAACRVFLVYSFVIRRTPFLSSRRPKGGRISATSTSCCAVLPRSFTALCSVQDDTRSGRMRCLIYDLWIMNYGVGTWRATLIDVWCIMYDV